MTLSNPAQYISGRTVQEQMNSLIDYVDTRSAEVATDAIASDVAQVHQDMLDADADAAAAAASAAAAAGTLANAVKKTGEASQSIAGDISVSGDLSVSGDAGVQGQLSVLGGCDLRAPVKIPVTPTNNDDAASKKYVDDALDNYAMMVRTVDDQIVNGPKRIKNPVLGVVGTNKRVTGTNVIEIGRFPYDDNVIIHFTGIITGREKLVIGNFKIITGTNAITSIALSKSIYLNNETFTQASVYAYIDGTEIVLCIGNSTSGNYIYSVLPLGLFRGAGLPWDLDVTNSGTNVTLPATYVSVVI